MPLHLPAYTPDGWALLRDVAPDVVMTFEEQRLKTAHIAGQFAARGIVVTEIVFDRGAVDEMVAWCEAEGTPVDSEARAAYGVLLAARLSDTEGSA